jgi:amidohydrolase
LTVRQVRDYVYFGEGTYVITRVTKLTQGIKPELIALSDYILENPELGYEEFKACTAHVELLRRHGFVVEDNYLDMATAFRAVYDSGKPGPTVAFLAEYDALPGIGHGCGHNMLGATSTGAGIVLGKMMTEFDIPGRVLVIGTPAEETSGAKVVMADKGAFADVDAVMQAHPSDGHYKSGSSLAIEAIEFTYRGRTSHAAASPERGINALDAAINTFVSINALRQHILPTARIHGVILEGGKAANIVPDLAIAQFYVRATTKTHLTELVEKVKNCARGAALAAGAGLEMRNYEASNDNLITNQTLQGVYTRRLLDMGVAEIKASRSSGGSSDAGNVSQVAPTIHPYFDITGKPARGHSVEFAAATRTPYAYDAMAQVVGALALTAHDILTDSTLLGLIKEEFERAEK